MRVFSILGIFAGLYLSWPVFLILENCKCFNEIIAKFVQDKMTFKSTLEIFPSYLLKSKNNKMFSKNKSLSRLMFSLIC